LCALLLMSIILPTIHFTGASAQGGGLAGTKWKVEATTEWHQREYTTSAKFIGEVQLVETDIPDYFLLSGNGSGDWEYSFNFENDPCEPYSGNGQIDFVTFTGDVSVVTLETGKTETYVGLGGVPGKDPYGADIAQYNKENVVNCYNPDTRESWTETKVTPPPSIAGAAGTMAEMTQGVIMNTDLSSAEPGAFVKVTAKISPPGIAYRVYGTVTDKEGKAMSGSKLVLADFEKISTDGNIEKLSQSKPAFEDDTTASDDNKAEYEFKIERGPDKLALKLLVISLLWFDSNSQFAITNGGIVGERYIPVYLPICIDHSGTNCVKWEKSGDGFDANVNFVYGSNANKYLSVIEMEDWNPGSSGSVDQLMTESAKIYYNSYRAMKYFEGLKGRVGVELNPIMIDVRHLEPNCNRAEFDAQAKADNKYPSFGDLGIYLSKVESTGSSIKICDSRSATTERDAPVNREWHELSHYLNYEMYLNFDREPFENHAGYANKSTNDSFAEAFAEFVAMLISEHYGSPAPYKYPIRESVQNMEEDVKVWNEGAFAELQPEDGSLKINTFSVPSNSEEFAIAGILWDLHDSGTEVNPKFVIGEDANGPIWASTSKIYPDSKDTVALSGEQILEVISKSEPKTLADLYNAFLGTVSNKELDMIFVNHGAFADVADRNLIQDLSGEQAGPTGHMPERMVRKSTPPALPGSFIQADHAATFNVRMVHKEPFSNYDFSYLLNMSGNEPAYFQMSPPYYPSKAIFDQVSSDGKTVLVSNATTVDSSKYWSYFLSNPAMDAIFITLPVSGSAPTTSDNVGTTAYPPPADSTSPPASGCLIATAAFGSELTPQVQFLRGFRDNHILSTASGSSFMNVFNAWYYSFSPQVADYERQQPWLQQSVRVAIYPLLGILQTAESAYAIVPGEYGSIAAGLVASSLIGAVYFSPIVLSIKQVRRNRLDYRLAIVIIGASLVSVAVAIIVNSVPALMATTALLVLSTLCIVAIYSAKGICKILQLCRNSMKSP
jgi:hypothetical protein